MSTLPFFSFTIQNVTGKRTSQSLPFTSDTTALYESAANAHNVAGPFRLIANGRVVPRDNTPVSQCGATFYLVPASSGAPAVVRPALNSDARAVKLFFGEECRRMRVESFDSLTFDALQGRLCKLYPTQYHPEMRLQYDDSDGDRITVQSNVEWEECKRELADKPTVRLFVSGGNGVYFKDGPAPQALGFYQNSKDGDNKLMVPANDDAKAVQTAVPRCLSRLFPGGKILPYNMPEWLKESGALRVVTQANGVADLDINLKLLWNALSQRALSQFDAKEYADARDILASMTEWQSNSSWAWYNLSCAHALLGDTDNALLSLQCALDAGYTNIAHMLKDEDLAAIRGTRGFNQLLNAHISKLEDK